MALARFALVKKLVSSSSSFSTPAGSQVVSNRTLLQLLPKQQQQSQQLLLQQQQRWTSTSNILRGFTTTASSEDKSDGREVTVSASDDGGDRKKSSSNWLPRKLRNRGGLWRRRNNNPAGALVPFNLNHMFSLGLGDALLQASDNLNRLFENWAPSRLIGRMKENESSYKLRYEVPGLAKEDVKITIEDRFLTIKGEHKEEEEEGSEDDEHWSSSSSYGYYEASLMLPDDAKVEEIKAEMKDGVLSITIPRTESTKEKDVKEIQIN